MRSRITCPPPNTAECKWRARRFGRIISLLLRSSEARTVAALFFEEGNKLRRNGLNKAPTGWHSATVPVTNGGVCAFYAMSGEHGGPHEVPKVPVRGHPFSINASPRSRARERAGERRKSNRASFRRELMQPYTNQSRKSAEWNFFFESNEIFL